MRLVMAGAAGILLAAGTATVAAAPPASAAQSAIQQTLDASAAAWNAGSLDRFMECYERSPATTYVGGARQVRGYEAIRAMYAERFGGGDKNAMGRLSLAITDFRKIGPDVAYVIGRFHLKRDVAHGGDASGVTTLLFKRTRAGWRIIADHS